MRTRLVTLLALAGAVVFAACGSGDEGPADVPHHPVLLAEVIGVELRERIEAAGELLAKQHAEVASQVAGEVTAILLDEGDAVEVGETVLEIDPERRALELDRARARVSEATAALREAERELARVLELSRSNVASRAQRETAETLVATSRSRLAATRADLGVADRALRDSSVTTRFSGLIARRYVSAGEYVSPGQKLFELISLDPIEVEFHVPEADTSRVAIGQSLVVRVAPFPDRVFRAEVSFVSPTVESRTRTLRVKAIVDNTEGLLRPGLFARSDLGVALHPDVAMLPEEAVLQRADGAVVFVLVDGTRVERRVIQTGRYRDGLVEVSNGLAIGDLVVRRGHKNLLDGSRVEARNADGSPAVAAGPPAADGAAADGS